MIGLIFVLAGCGSEQQAIEFATETSGAAPILYKGRGTIVATPDGAVTLCGGAQTLEGRYPPEPPSCAIGVRVAGVDIRSIPTVQTIAGTAFVDDVTVVGTWDGTTLAVTGPPMVGGPVAATAIDFPGCPRPLTPRPPLPGSFDEWNAATEALDRFAAENPDLYAGRWSADGSVETLVVALTDGNATNVATVAGVYPWACVVERPHTEAEGRGIEPEILSAALPHGNRVMSTGFDPVMSAEVVSVLVLDPATQHWFDERYGDLVDLRGELLVPV
jgi:hypothetical protein